MKKLLLTFFLVMPAINFGLLPPLYDTLNELKSLVNDERLPKALQSGEAIMSITRQADSFLVTTNKNTLVVKIITEPTRLIGPRQYHLEFETAKPLEQNKAG